MILKDYEYSLPLTDAHLAELGRIVAESSVLEAVLSIAIWQILNVPHTIGEQLTTSPNLGQLVNMLTTILPKVLVGDDDAKAFEPIKQELKAVVALRNHVAHCYWTFGVKQDEPRSLNYRNESGEILPRTRTWPVDDLKRIAARISRVGDELEWFLRSRGADMPPPQTRDWRPYQVPPEPKWEPLTGRVPPSQRPPSPESSQVT